MQTKWQKFWCLPTVDRWVAFVLVLVTVQLALGSIEDKRGFALTVMLVNLVIHNGLLLFRHHPQRVSPRLWVWFLALAGANWHLWYVLLKGVPTTALLPDWITSGLAFVGTLLFIWARISLGRNFGIVPAQRELVEGGAYRFMRHPLYTSSLMTSLAFLLSHFSIPALTIWFTGLGLLVMKAFQEEFFLESDPQYARYKMRVPYRFFPEVI